MKSSATETSPRRHTSQPLSTTIAPSPRLTQEVATQTGPPLRDYRAELREEQWRTERHERHHQEAMARLKEEASQRMAEIRALADRKIQEQNEALARLQAQAASREPRAERQSLQTNWKNIG